MIHPKLHFSSLEARSKQPLGLGRADLGGDRAERGWLETAVLRQQEQAGEKIPANIAQAQAPHGRLEPPTHLFLQFLQVPPLGLQHGLQLPDSLKHTGDASGVTPQVLTLIPPVCQGPA